MNYYGAIDLAGALRTVRKNTLIIAEEIPEDSYSFRAAPETRTVAQLLTHIAVVQRMPEQIHSIIDRHRTAALPFAGSSLLSHHFHEVPLLSLAWGVGQIGLPFSESGAISVLGVSLPLQDGATIVASVTPTLPLAGSLRMRVEEIATSEQDAESQAASLNFLLSLARRVTVPLAQNAANNGLKEVLKTAQIAQKHDRVVVTATLTPSILNGIAAGTNSAPSPETEAIQGASK